jgi:hypothetical protein
LEHVPCSRVQGKRLARLFPATARVGLEEILRSLAMVWAV